MTISWAILDSGLWKKGDEPVKCPCLQGACNLAHLLCLLTFANYHFLLQGVIKYLRVYLASKDTHK